MIVRGAFLVAVACLLLASSGAAHAGEDPGRPAMSPEEQLAQKYAPIIYLREQREACDTRGSPYFAAPVEFVLDTGDIVLRRHVDGRTTDVKAAPSPSDLYGLDDTYFLDFPGNPRRPGCVYERDFLARSTDYTPTAYAHIAYQEGEEGFALQYWVFYYFNHWNNTHEGDWEMIQLTFEGPTPADALSQDPTGLGYSQHGSGERAEWGDGKVTLEQGRPVAFAAAGANANQFQANIILGRGENGTGFGCDDARKPHRRYGTEAVLVEEPSSATDDFPWLAYDGRWGERAPWEFNGPTGPNDKLAWTEPFTWHERLRPSSIIVPTSDTLGPNAVNIFCDVVWYMSAPFGVLLHLPPWVFAVGGLALVGGAAFATTRTRYIPPDSTNLRRRRRFGQILSSAFRIYREHATLFLLIGVIMYVPAGLLESVVQWIARQTPLMETILGFYPDNVVAEAAIWITLGNFASSIVYWFVLMAAVAGVRRIESRRRDEPLASYRQMFRMFTTVAIPRLKAAAIIVLLGITLVGIPWALRHSVRWAFIEHTVLLDGTQRDRAMAASAAAVDGRWWRTAFALAFLGFLGYFLGPLIAFVLMFWSSASVSAINMASSITFALMTPFVAIAQSLLYFDHSHDGEAEEGAAS